MPPQAEYLQRLWYERRAKFAQRDRNGIRVRSVLTNDIDVVFKDIVKPDDEPVVGNLVWAAARTISQRVGRMPRIDTQPLEKFDEGNKQRAEKHEKRLTDYTVQMNFAATRLQAAYWLVTHDLAPLVVRPAPEYGIPVVEVRDPLTCYPGTVWPHKPDMVDTLFVERVTAFQALSLYPQLKGLISDQGDIVESVTIGEYFDGDGVTVCLLEPHVRKLDFIPNPCPGRPMVVLTRGFSPDLGFHGQFDHVIAALVAQAKLFAVVMAYAHQQVSAEALALDTPLPTPTGWTTMGKVSKGDLLIGSDGLPVEVTKATTVQMDRDCYRITFDDGTSIVASDGHLWESRCQAGSRLTRVRSTREMADDGRRFRVPVSSPWKMPEASLPIDPYVLGAWLGDGTSRNAQITAGERDIEEMRKLFEIRGYPTRLLVNGGRCPGFGVVSNLDQLRPRKGHGTGLWTQLCQAGLLQNKHIPQTYLRASIDQRLELVRGLMDTDGTVSRAGGCSFSNTNERIVDGLCELLRSLGDEAFKRWIADTRFRAGGYFKISFTPRRFNPFHMVRKAERVRLHNRGPAWVGIRSIERVDSVPVRCVAVAATDHLFLAGPSGSVTHNTVVVGELTSNMGKWATGPGAVNTITPMPGAQATKLTNNMSVQVFNELDRLERAIRLGGQFPAQLSGEPVASIATGRGLEQLTLTVDDNVAYWQSVLDDACMRALGLVPSIAARMGSPGFEDFAPDVVTYCRSLSGADPAEAVRLLQFQGAKDLSRMTIMERLPEVDAPLKEMERIDVDDMRQALLRSLDQQMAVQQLSPDMLAEMIHRRKKGEQIEDIWKDLTEIQQQQQQEQQEQMAAAGGPGNAQTQGAGSAPPLSQVLNPMAMAEQSRRQAIRQAAQGPEARQGLAALQAGLQPQPGANAPGPVGVPA